MLTKIGQMAWQNRSDSKNRTDFGCSCKRGVKENFKGCVNWHTCHGCFEQNDKMRHVTQSGQGKFTALNVSLVLISK